MRRALAAAVAGLAMTAAAPAPKLLGWPDLLSRPLPRADARIAYGTAPEQVVELFRPAGKGPFPVVVMVHGGCWRSSLANLTIMNYAADDLRRRGVAVWNVEYRGVDRPGGGYPGTYLDVAAAAAALQREAAARDLDLSRVAFVGHSAGGHLVVWLAGAWTIATGPLASAATLEPAAVFVLGGVPDLSTAAEACGDKAVQAMTGAASAGRPDPLADTSGAALLPLGVTLAVRNGGADETATPANAKAFAAKAKAAGDRVSLEITPRQGHAEEIAPGSPAWDHAAAEIVRALRVDRRNPSFDAGADRP